MFFVITLESWINATTCYKALIKNLAGVVDEENWNYLHQLCRSKSSFKEYDAIFSRKLHRDFAWNTHDVYEN